MNQEIITSLKESMSNLIARVKDLEDQIESLLQSDKNLLDYVVNQSRVLSGLEKSVSHIRRYT